jgi:hypothetical protein
LVCQITSKFAQYKTWINSLLICILVPQLTIEYRVHANATILTGLRGPQD